MKTKERKIHWEKVFETKDTTKVSWYQAVPQTSLQLIKELQLSISASIIEVGSGDSFLADHLFNNGYLNISLLDISELALSTLKKRLTNKGFNAKFIASDICNFSVNNKYDLWHDRAVFHFLTSKTDIDKYVSNVSKSLKKGGFFIVGAFSKHGPLMCSDLNIQQYSAKTLESLFASNFKMIENFTEDHTTPSGGIQNFVFCVFQRK